MVTTNVQSHADYLSLMPAPDKCIKSVSPPPSHLLQFPLGRRAACDIYWHGVSFHDNDHIISGQVNKFPGKPPMLATPPDDALLRRSCTFVHVSFRHD